MSGTLDRAAHSRGPRPRARFWRLAPLALLVAGGLLACGPVALRVMRTGAERAMSSDPIADLPDGLHVALCGAGGPLPDAKRSGPCVAVVAGSSMFVVDAGSGGARNLQSPDLNWRPGHIRALFLTHFHSDHIDGLGEMGMLRWVGGSHREPLPVHGPEGVVDVVEGFQRAYRHDFRYRTAHHGEAVVPSSGAGFAARPFDAPPLGESLVLFEQDGVRISAFRVEHEPVSPAVGYRFDYGGRSLVVSGDTSRSESLLAAAKGVDLIVHEALSPKLVGVMHDAATETGQDALAKITHDILDYHASPVEAAEIAEAAGADHLLFYHVVPPLPLPGLASVWLEGVSDVYSGDVTLGVDGTILSLPSGGDEIEVLAD
jgi:ribonuclease Z